MELGENELYYRKKQIVLLVFSQRLGPTRIVIVRMPLVFCIVAAISLTNKPLSTKLLPTTNKQKRPLRGNLSETNIEKEC